MSISKFQAVLSSKCPRCRTGKMFSGSAYGLSRQKMHEHCPHCGFKFEIEPGYFYAAMYVSYAFSVGEVLCMALVTALATKSESPWTYIIVLFTTIVLFAPFNYRYSRLVLLHYLSPKVSYNPKYAEVKNKL
ncbi:MULTISPECIES: DUF983 domain-containing protein [Sphingobacterium]|uniref:DUF983 domain-containing protein n=1 Tax=Sphingobacterium hotanense TaxID=649196 RepID=A0ABT7NIT3_9SPHI|nr:MULTISPECIES: DUF983 domain-containing protein [Sphingobacterium]MCT1523261.1 DUF983 domain-containing protein [Sphingobacterium hotanense]MDM1047103.1 DUF983 domain-containing protein [Sphingobacterium hotanense]